MLFFDCCASSAVYGKGCGGKGHGWAVWCCSWLDLHLAVREGAGAAELAEVVQVRVAPFKVPGVVHCYVGLWVTPGGTCLVEGRVAAFQDV